MDNRKIPKNIAGNKKNENNVKSNKAYLVPIFLILSVLPLITRMKEYKTKLSEFAWFSSSSDVFDFFLYYKSIFFIILSIVMFVIILVSLAYFKKSNRFLPIFAPLAGYAFLAILSSLLSTYREISFAGGYEHFESVLVLLGYCIVVYYGYLFVQIEEDIRFVLKGLLICVIALTFLAITQATGHDFLMTTVGKKLIVDSKYWNYLDSLTFNFDKWVYLTLFNPNYVGSYVVLVTPLILVLTFFSKNKLLIPIYLVAISGLGVALIFSSSDTGLIAFTIALLLAIVLFRRYLLRHFIVSLAVLIILSASVYYYNSNNNNVVYSKISQFTNFNKIQYNLTDIQTNDDELVIVYKGNELHIRLTKDSNDAINFSLLDQNEQAVTNNLDPAAGTFTLQDERFPGFVVTPVMYSDILAFSVVIDGKEWLFTNQTDGTYYYINYYGKFDKMIKSEAAFVDYDTYASGRGYIWSRSIPLLKKYILLGSGADTFVIAFPQQDYVGQYNAGFNNSLDTKPHNMYLQIGVQTGVLSLIAFLIFYGMYFVSSIRLYFRGRFNSLFEQVGVGIFIGTFGYMITGIANDSTITVAPVFWTLMGIGIAVNQKVKHLIKVDILVEQKQTDPNATENEQKAKKKR